jgi:hypothetical protein
MSNDQRSRISNSDWKSKININLIEVNNYFYILGIKGCK